MSDIQEPQRKGGQRRTVIASEEVTYTGVQVDNRTKALLRNSLQPCNASFEEERDGSLSFTSGRLVKVTREESGQSAFPSARDSARAFFLRFNRARNRT